jgi:hypothetical protein
MLTVSIHFMWVFSSFPHLVKYLWLEAGIKKILKNVPTSRSLLSRISNRRMKKLKTLFQNKNAFHSLSVSIKTCELNHNNCLVYIIQRFSLAIPIWYYFGVAVSLRMGMLGKNSQSIVCRKTKKFFFFFPFLTIFHVGGVEKSWIKKIIFSGFSVSEGSRNNSNKKMLA